MKLKKKKVNPGYDGNPFAGAPYFTDKCPECKGYFVKGSMVVVDGEEVCAFCATKIDEEGNARVEPHKVVHERIFATISCSKTRHQKASKKKKAAA